MNKDLLTIQKAADLLGVSTKTLRRWEKSGKLIPQRTKGNQRRYSLEEISNFKSQISNKNQKSRLPKPQPVLQAEALQAGGTGGQAKIKNSDFGFKTHDFSGSHNSEFIIQNSGPQIISPLDSFSLMRLEFGKIGSPKKGIIATSLFLLSLSLIVVGAKTGSDLFLNANIVKGIPNSQVVQNQQNSAVLGASTQSNSYVFRVNVPSSFADNADFLNGITIQGKSLILGGIDTGNGNINAGTGTITASNVIYSLTPGTGLSVSGGQTPTITNTGVTSLGGSTGAISLTGGTGISISGLTITNSDLGSSQDIFKNITAGGNTITAGSNNDTLTLSAGTGVTLSSDTTNKTITISSTNAGGGVTSLNTQTGALTLAAGTGLSLTGLTFTNTGVTSLGGQTGPLSLTGGTGISIAGLTVTNTDLGSLQNIFKNITVGGSTISASLNNDNLNFAAGSNVNLSADTNTKTITISSTISNSTINSVSGWTQSGNYVTLTNPSNYVGIGTATPVGALNIVGAPVGQALFNLNYTGSGQNILTASSSGATVFTLDSSGNLNVTGTISQNGAALNPMLAVGDLIVGSGAPTNKALSSLGATATSTGSWGGVQPVANVIDGLDGTYGVQGNGSNGSIITVDLKKAYTVSVVRLKQGSDTGGGGGVPGYSIWYSNDGVNFTELLIHTCTVIGDETYSITPTTARYWQIRADQGNNGWQWVVYTWELRASDTPGLPARLAVGSNGQVLTADSTQSLGLAWENPAWTQSGNYVTLTNSSNYVGIGTSNPSANLDIAGSASIAGQLAFENGFGTVQTTNNQLLTFGGNTTGDIQFKPGNSSSSLYLASTGNVGVGTINPKSPLDVFGNLTIDDSTNSVDSNTLLLLHMDGTNGSTSFTDSSSFGNTVSANGSAQISTAQSEFGGASGYFDGSTSYLTSPANSNWNFGTGDFTIDTWIYPVSRIDSYPAIFSNYNSFGAGSLAIFVGHGSADTTKYQVAFNGVFPAIQSTTSITYNAWTHIAVVRSGGVITLYINGVANGTYNSSASVAPIGSNVYIGVSGDNIANAKFNGYIDEFRVSKGIARWTSNFTPPTAAYGAPVNYALRSGNIQIGTFDIYDQTDGLSRLAINGSGYIGLGTTNPSATLDVAGNASLAGQLTFENGYGTIQTTANQPLILGGNTTGNITLNPLNGTGNVTLNGGFNVAVSSGSYPYKKAITIDNTANASTLSNFQVNVKVDTASLISAGKMNSNCSDIRITDSDGVTQLNYFVDSGCNTSSTSIWVKVPTIAASSTKTIYLYYGNPSASSLSNGNNVFEFFDDFSGSSLDGTKWQANTWSGSGTTVNVSGSYVQISTGTNNAGGITAKTGFNLPFIMQGAYAYLSGSQTSTRVTDAGTSGSDSDWLSIDTTGTGRNYGKRTGGTLYYYQGFTMGNATQFTNFEWDLQSGNAVYYENGIQGNTVTTQDRYTTQVLYPELASWSGGVSRYDWIGIRQYTSTEPTITVGTESYTPNTSIYTNSTTGNVGIQTTNPTAFALQVAGNVGPNGTDTYNLGSSSLEWNNLYVKNIITALNSTGQNGYWNRGTGAVSLNNITDDLLLGGSTTSSATFAFLNNGLSRGNQVASLSGSLVLDSSTASIQSTNNQLLTLGGNTTGDMQFKPGNSTSSLYLASSGNIGVGTTAPVGKLQVNQGNLLVTGSNGDVNTKLLLHADGPNGSTSFTDSENTPKAVTAYGNAQISTSQYEFGGSSASFDGTNSYLTVTNTGSDFVIGSKWTFDAWIYPTSLSGTHSVMGYNNVSASDFYDLLLNGNQLEFRSRISGSETDWYSTSTLVVNTWQHIAVVVSNGTLHLYINGVDAGGSGPGTFIATQNATFGIGRNLYGNGYDDYYQGYMDEIRISDVARWTSNFTPPTSEYSSVPSAIGIGVTNPLNLLDVAGGAVFGSGYAGTYSAPTNGLLVLGNVGIGTSNPNFKLDVQDTQSSTATAMFTNLSTSSTADVLALKVATTSAQTGNYFASFLDGNGNILGKIQANGNGGVTYATNGIDFAEYFRKENASEVLTPGEAVCLGPTGGATKCSSTSANILGIVSGQAGFVGGGNHDGDPNYIIVGLVGQLPVNVSTASGMINPGDNLTVDPAGVIVKAVSAGQIIGQALQGYNGAGDNKINMRVNVSWYDPNAGSLALTANLNSLQNMFSFNSTASSFLNSSTAATGGAITSFDSLNTNNATVSGNLMVLGRTTLNNLGITGVINNGLLTVNGLDQVNGQSVPTINSLGDLYLQNQALGGVNILNGKVTIDTNGTLTVQGKASVGQLSITSASGASATIGSGTIASGQTSVTIVTNIVSSDSKIFITPTTPTGAQEIFVTKNPGSGFTANIEKPYGKDINFDWWVVGTQ